MLLLGISGWLSKWIANEKWTESLQVIKCERVHLWVIVTNDVWEDWINYLHRMHEENVVMFLSQVFLCRVVPLLRCASFSSNALISVIAVHSSTTYLYRSGFSIDSIERDNRSPIALEHASFHEGSPRKWARLHVADEIGPLSRRVDVLVS